MKKVKDIFKPQWQPTGDTWLAMGAGLVVILLSYSLNLLQSDGFWTKALTFLILTLGIRIGIGFYFPLRYEILERDEGWAFFGITKRRWGLSLILNIVFAVLLLLMFLSESAETGERILFNKDTLTSVYYILVAGVFEMIFIYGFLRKTFERAFGLIPSLILTALFYSFYHVGFQPEFLKLFFVGLLYSGAFRLTENVLIIFPFFWGVGAAWDVLVNFGATELSGVWVLGEAIIATILMTGIVTWIIRKRKTILQSQS
jgi:membrane protease YdiL (CAAX protease family)